MYDNLYDTCIGAVKDLQRLFSLPYRLDYDGKKLVANRDEVSEAIRVNFKVELSEDERKYYGLVANVVNALNEMQAFEKEHGYVQFSLMELIVQQVRIFPQSFANVILPKI
jgi:hypothetical protein